MLAILMSFFLSQLDLSKTPQPTVEEFAERAAAHNRKADERRLTQSAPKPVAKSVLARMGPAARKAYREREAEHKKNLATLEATVNLAAPELMVRDLKVDAIGALMELVPYPVTLPNGRGGVSRFTGHRPEPAGLTVVDVVSDGLLLVRSGEETFALIPDPGHNATDGADYPAKGVFVVVGRFTHPLVSGAKATVPLLQRWKHADEWEQTKQQIQAEMEAKIKAKKNG